jgi:two-component system LytT family response regulator
MASDKDSEIKLLIVDDEKKACDNLQAILSRFIDSKVNIVGVANNTIEAERLISVQNPDAVFLDIEMPGENAFQFLERINPYRFEIIFVTAYDEFAIRAFKLNAIDYILKPIDIDDLATAIFKLRDRIYYKSLVEQGTYQIDTLKQIVKKEQPSKIILKSANNIEVVDFNDIYSFEGMGSYCNITFNSGGDVKEITGSYSISFYEELLPKSFFYRVHKSYLINCKQIENIVSDGDHYVILKNEDEIPISRRRYGPFLDFLKENKFYNA